MNGKEDVIHRCNGILLSHLKEWNNAVCSHIDDPGDYHMVIILSEVSQRETNIIYHLYVESKKNDKNELITKQKQTHRLREWTYDYWGAWVRGGID